MWESKNLRELVINNEEYKNNKKLVTIKIQVKFTLPPCWLVCNMCLYNYIIHKKKKSPIAKQGVVGALEV